MREKNNYLKILRFNMRMVTYTVVRALSQVLGRVLVSFVIKMKMKSTVEIGMIINTMGMVDYSISKLRR